MLGSPLVTGFPSSKLYAYKPDSRVAHQILSCSHLSLDPERPQPVSSGTDGSCMCRRQLKDQLGP